MITNKTIMIVSTVNLSYKYITLSCFAIVACDRLKYRVVIESVLVDSLKGFALVTRDVHGLDSSMDWIELDWVRLLLCTKL